MARRAAWRFHWTRSAVTTRRMARRGRMSGRHWSSFDPLLAIPNSERIVQVAGHLRIRKRTLRCDCHARHARAADPSPGDRRHLQRQVSPGGLVDIEYLIQGLQINHGAQDPALRLTNIRAAMSALHAAGCSRRRTTPACIKRTRFCAG